MTLLAPGVAVVAAAIAGPLLVALYLLRLRRRPVRVSSILFWQRVTRDLEANVPLRLLRPTALLLLQAMALALLVLALGRPAMHTHAPPPPRTILLLDRSASMAAVDLPQGPSRFELARQQALALVEQLSRAPGRRELMLIAFAAEPDIVQDFTSDWRAVRAALSRLEPTDQPARLAPAVELVNALARAPTDELGSVQPPAVVIISDGSMQTAGSLTVAAGSVRYERVGPADTTTGQPNFGITALAARRDWSDPAVVRLFVGLLSTDARPRSVPISLSIDGRLVERRVVELPPASSQGADGTPAPGEAAITFLLEQHASGLATVAIELADALAADNTAAILLRPPATATLALVAPETGTDDASSPAAWILADVLEELRPRVLVRNSPADWARREQTGQWPAVDLVIFDRVQPAVLPPMASLSFAGAVPIPGLELRAPDPAVEGTRVLAWQRDHPVLRHVSLDTLYVARPWRVRIDRQQLPAGTRVEELVHGRSGPLIVLFERGATRRLLVAFELAQSNWPAHFGFPIFLANVIDYLALRGEDSAGVAYTTGQSVSLRPRAGATAITLAGPVELRVPMPDTGAEAVSIGLLPRVGVYSASGAEPATIPVNLLDPTESRLAGADALAIGGQIVTTTPLGAQPTEIWPWFVIAALGVLVLEWLLSLWLGRS